MEVNYDLVTSILARQVETGDELGALFLDLLRVWLLFD